MSRNAIFRVCFLLILLSAQAVSAQAPKSVTAAEQAYQATLTELCQALLSVQNNTAGHADMGGLKDPESGLYYTRAAEAVFPFAVMFQRSGQTNYRDAAIRLGNWLLRQQQPGGEWIENPWTWTGTTADQLIMMASAYPILSDHLSATERQNWRSGISRAADYLTRVMSPDFASINYVPTTAGALAVTWKNIEQKPAWAEKAKLLATQTLAKMDDDYFIEGEAARYHDVKYGVDLGYQIDMSLWGLAMYAMILDDAKALNAVRASLERVIYFFYPNGGIDASWGARCYKWTAYGSKTADGCQVLLSLFAHENPVYQTAALRNLEYLRTAIKDGFVGYGKHIWGLPGRKANLYPTFARAKNLAMALAWGKHQSGTTPPMPADKPGWVKYFPTVKVGLVRTGPWMATISAYDYADRDNWGQGKYHHFPHGGALCNVHVDGLGWLTTSSQTKYTRGEYIHMPEITDTVICLTPRFEYRNKYGYFTNLYDGAAELSVQQTLDGAQAAVSGAICDSLGRPGGVAFRANYLFTDKTLRKSVTLRYHDRTPMIRFVEPIVLEAGVTVKQRDAQTVEIKSPGKTLLFRVTSGNARLKVGERAEQYWYPFPGLRAYPVVLEVDAPAADFKQTVEYVYEIQ